MEIILLVYLVIKKYSIDSSFEEFYPNASEETIVMTKEFFKKLANAPTEYFEIKPNRAVGINEFKRCYCSL